MICKIEKKGNRFVAYERMFFCFLPIYEAHTLNEAQYFLEAIHSLKYDRDTRTYRND
jgi:hypothetical protein